MTLKKRLLQNLSSRKLMDKLHVTIDTRPICLLIGRMLTIFPADEHQRLKMTKPTKKNESIFVLDERTAGLHLSDIKKFNCYFQRLVGKGNTLIVIEHHSEIIKQTDRVIDIGPDDGVNGGNVAFGGTPEDWLTITEEY